jgi:hypothetical protein
VQSSLQEVESSTDTYLFLPNVKNSTYLLTVSAMP